MRNTRVKKLYALPALALMVVLALSGCGGGGGKGSADSKSANATISGAVSIKGKTDCSGVVVVAEKLNGGVTRSVERMLSGAKAGRVVESRAGAETAGVYVTTSGSDCQFKLSVEGDNTYSVSAYKEDSVGAQPQRITARSAAVVTVNFELVATGKISGTALLGNAGSDLVVVFLDGTSYAAFASSNGAYTISNIPVGTYTIKFSRKGTIYAENAGVVVTAGVTTNDALTSVDFLCVVNEDCDDSDDATVNTCDLPASTGSICKFTPYVAGGTIINADTTWSQGPVVIGGQIKVASGVTLTIAPGVEVQFEYPAVGGDLFQTCCRDQATLSGIRVDGTLSAVGTVDSPISFTLTPDSAKDGAGYWGGIYLNYGTANLEYVNMNYPSYAIQSNYGNVSIANVAITNAGLPAGETSYSYSYHVSVKTAAGWKEVGVRHYGLQYETQQINLSGYLPDADGEYKVRIEQAGMYAAQIESIEMLMDGRPVAPVSARNTATREDITYKVVRSDNDVVDAHLKTFEVKFDARGAKPARTELALKAREEDGSVTTSGVPFLFPANSRNDNVATAEHFNYKLGASKGALNLDGMISANDRLPTPAFAQKVSPMSGHPEGTVYGYVKNDNTHLYVTLDFTSDNTMDGAADFSAVYVKVGNAYKKFRVSVGETKYGSVGFNYTGNVSYQHKVYEFAIPLSEIGSPAAGQQVAYIIEAYGTSSLFNAVVNAYYGTVSISDLSVAFSPTATGNFYGVYLYNALSGGQAMPRKSGNRKANVIITPSPNPGGITNISVSGAPSSGVYISEYNGNAFLGGINVTGTKNGPGFMFYGNGAYGFLCDNCSVSDSIGGDGMNIQSVAGVSLTNCSVTNAAGNGITLYSVTGDNTIQNCDISFNEGPGISSNYSAFSISNSKIEGNCREGIYTYAGAGEIVSISSSNILNNGLYGVMNSYGNTVYMDNVFLSGNNGVGSGVVDDLLDLNSPQKYNISEVLNPATALITAVGMPTVAGSVTCPVNSYY